MRITILFSSLANYSVALFRHLAADHNSRLELIYQPPRVEAPYNQFDLSFCEEILEDSKEIQTRLLARVRAFRPDCILMCSWNFPHFMRVARILRREGVYVVSAMDNQWHGTAKQWLGVITSPIFLKPSIDTFLVSGDRQAGFARRLGYDDVMYGYYAADVEHFSRAVPAQGAQQSFLFVGRLAREKGLDILLKAYLLYRSSVSEPWSLTVVGAGRLKHLLDGIPGVHYEGFVQPNDLPRVMYGAGALVLPSRFEPWGVVIQEAAACGLPIICTTTCGASTYFVRDGVNGFVIPVDARALAGAMHRLSTAEKIRRRDMGQRSLELARLWTPQMLARYFVESVSARIERRAASRKDDM